MIATLKENFDEYSLKARVFPGFIGLIPFGILAYYFLEFNFETGFILNAGVNTTIFLCVAFFVSDVVRNLGKHAEIKIFSSGLCFPTTDYLFGEKIFISAQRYNNIRSKARVDFIIELPENKLLTDNKETRVLLKELVDQVRQVVKDGRLVMQTNIRYGFWRNLIGLSPLSLGICIFSVIYFIFNTKFEYICIFLILSIFYLLLFVFRRKLLQFFGFQYAEQLFLEYLDKR